MPKTIRSSYTAKEKLSVIAYSKETFLREAEKKYGIHYSQISRWRKNESILLEAKPNNRRIGAGTKPFYSNVEEELIEWIKILRQDGIAVTPLMIQQKMKSLIGNDLPNDKKIFLASRGWLDCFMNRYNLSIRQKTKIGQKLPIDLSSQLESFYKFIETHHQKNQYHLSQIANMDETPIFFDMVGNSTVEKKGTKTIQIRTTGNDKNRFTCVLTVLADGTKLTPMVIFKGKMLPKNLPFNIVVKMQEKGWMNEDLMKVWFQEVWEKHFKSDEKTLLIMDSFEGHKTKSIKEKCQEMNIDLAIIPGGLTSLVQPLDVCLNKPFKDRMRKKWQDWMANKEYSFTKGGNLQKPSYNLICRWILEVWNDIPIETVCNSFKKCKIV